MKTLFTILFALLALGCKSSSGPIEDEEKLIEISETILSHLDAGSYEAVRLNFNVDMKNALAPESIKNVWEGLENQVGPFREKGNVITDEQEGYRVVYIICKFEKSPAKLKVIFDDADQVAGLFLIPVNQK